MSFTFALLMLGAVPADTGTYVRTIGDRSYRVTLPPRYRSLRRMPVVFLFHGFTGTALLAEGYTGMRALANKEQFILVTPDGTGQPQGWNAGFINLGRATTDDLAFFERLLAEVRRDFKVDRRRVYAVGHSSGGMFVNALAARYGEQIAGVVAVAGLIGVGMPGRETRLESLTGRPSALHIHGTADTVVGIDGQARALLKGVPAVDAIRWWGRELNLGQERTVNKPRTTETYFVRGLTEARLIAIEGWGHDWATPSRGGFDTTTVAWEFLKRRITP